MAASSTTLSSQEYARVEDYLNDKLQSQSDLESLDSLLQTLRDQHELQRKQVCDRSSREKHKHCVKKTNISQLVEAQEALEEATKASNDHRDAVRNKAQEFNQEQADIDRRLKIITQSETSDEAVRVFESSMEKLRRLDVAKGYLSLLQEVESLRSVEYESFDSAQPEINSTVVRMLLKT